MYRAAPAPAQPCSAAVLVSLENAAEKLAHVGQLLLAGAVGHAGVGLCGDLMHSGSGAAGEPVRGRGRREAGRRREQREAANAALCRQPTSKPYALSCGAPASCSRKGTMGSAVPWPHKKGTSLLTGSDWKMPWVGKRRPVGELQQACAHRWNNSGMTKQCGSTAAAAAGSSKALSSRRSQAGPCREESSR